MYVSYARIEPVEEDTSQGSSWHLTFYYYNCIQCTLTQGSVSRKVYKLTFLCLRGLVDFRFFLWNLSGPYLSLLQLDFP